MDDDELAATPFDPANGIRFKCGHVYLDRNRELADFQEATGFALPIDFLDMIGDYCEGTFGGLYRVHFKSRAEVLWDRLLLMRVAKPHEFFGYDDTTESLRINPDLFGLPGHLSMFPFGKAIQIIGEKKTANGFLAFDVRRRNSIVFASTSYKGRIKIATSFREMMLGSEFVCYG